MSSTKFDPGQKVGFFGKKIFDFKSQNFFEYVRCTLVRVSNCSFDNCEQTLKISAKSDKDSKSYQGNRECSSAKIAFWENRIQSLEFDKKCYYHVVIDCLYLQNGARYWQAVCCIRFSMKFCIRMIGIWKMLNLDILWVPYPLKR